MSTNTSTSTLVIENDRTAADIIVMVKNQIRNEKTKYLAYVAEHEVTTDNVADHVKALRELAYPGVKADGRADESTREGKQARDAKRFADKVRLGLRTAIDDRPSDRENNAQNLLTRAGVAASLDDVVAAWHAAQPSESATA